MSQQKQKDLRADIHLLRETVSLCRLYAYGYRLLLDSKHQILEQLGDGVWLEVSSHYAARIDRTTALIRAIEAFEYNIVSSPQALAAVDMEKNKIALEQAAQHSPKRLLQLLRAIESYLADIPESLLCTVGEQRAIPTYILERITLAKVEAKASLSLKVGLQ